MRPKEKIEAGNMKTDVVIIGAGGAGLCAAIAAAEKGAEVTVIEKRRFCGGNSKMATAIFAAESDIQKRANFNFTKDDTFKSAMEYAHWKIDPRIVRAFMDKSADTIKWLEDRGVRFLPPRPPDSYQRFQTAVEIAGTGASLIRILVKKSEQLGVRLLRQTAGKELIIDGKGRVRGVVADTKDGEIRVTAKSVIIASGGYGANKELLKKFFPMYFDGLRCFGAPNKGEGLMMALEIGAATEGLGILQYKAMTYSGSGQIDFFLQRSAGDVIWVNKYGERFADETISQSAENTNAIIRQPGHVHYVLFDSTALKRELKAGINRQMPPFVKNKPDLMGEIRSDEKKGKIKVADSWEEIASWIGAEPRALKATVEEYNAFCDQEYDSFCLKDPKFLVPLRKPPFYAIKRHIIIYGTTGGIKVNDRMEVLNQKNRPIPGLFAVGNDAGGWISDTYNWHLSGSAFGFALNSGRIAGENAIS